MNYRLVDDPSVAQVFNDNAFQENGRYLAVPHPLGVHDDNRPTTADTEAGRFASFDATGPEKQSFALQEQRQK
jgi:hypothetical protein